MTTLSSFTAPEYSSDSSLSEISDSDDGFIGLYLSLRRRPASFNSRQFPITQRRFSLDNYSESEFYTDFRFSKNDFSTLCNALGLSNRLFTVQKRVKIRGDEAIAFLHYRLAYPRRLKDYCSEFGRSQSVSSRIINYTLKWLYTKYGDLSFWDEERLSDENIKVYADAIAARTPELSGCYGFIDGTTRPIARPTKNAEKFFSSHKRNHVLKYQCIVFPDGIIGHFYGPTLGVRNDARMLRESGVLERLERYRPRYIYGDGGYPLSRVIMCPFKGAFKTVMELEFNRRASRSRVSIENSFGFLSQEWAYLNLQQQQKSLLIPTGLIYFASVFLKNCKTCITGYNLISERFDCPPPSLEDYLRSA